MVTEIKIIKTKNAVSRNFIFETGEVKTEGLNFSNQSASLTLPKDSPSDDTESFDINLGVSKDLVIEWTLYKQINDRAEGTYTSQVKTYAEMLNYLEDVICFPGIGVVDYQITITDKFRTRTAIYSFEDFSINVDSSIRPKGTLKFKWKRQVV